MNNKSAATALRAQKTNLGVVTDIMDFSRFGALSQVFVMEALASYAQSVNQTPAADLEGGAVPGAVWKGVAEEVLGKLAKAGYVQVQERG
jgi:hypothetical protein